MTSSQAMLATHPRELGVDTAVLARTIDALLECASTCNQCADACLGEDDPASQVRCIHRNMDCADICETTARVLSRRTEPTPGVARAQLEACIAACGACADECEQHAEHMEHCKVCAESCRRCEAACRELLGALG